MKRVSVCLGLGLALMGCDEVAMSTIGGAGTSEATGRAGAYREYLVLGSTMPFEECRARGGIIIRDAGSPMVACDPRVRREPVPANEFDHPGSPVPQQQVAAEG